MHFSLQQLWGDRQWCSVQARDAVAGLGAGLFLQAPGMRKGGKQRFCEDSGISTLLVVLQKIW